MSAADWNAGVIEEFRGNHGRVGGPFRGAPLLLVSHRGAKTGKARVNPLMYLKDGDRYLVFASNGGAPKNPGWYYNLKANPEVQIEVGDETVKVRAHVLEADERERFYSKQAVLYPQFAEYQRKTERRIPVLALVPR